MHEPVPSLLIFWVLFRVGTNGLDYSWIGDVYLRFLDTSPFTDFECPVITQIENIVEYLPVQRIDAADAVVFSI